MRVPTAKDVDVASLAAQLTTALGVPVAVSARNPGQKDNQGNALPGVIVLIDPATGKELPDQDQAKVVQVLATHAVPPAPVTPAAALQAALGTATTAADVITALKVYVGSVVTQEAKERERQRGGGGKPQG